MTGYAQEKSVIVKFCPPALYDFSSFPTIQAGIEYKFSKKMSWYNEIGVQYLVPGYQVVDTNFLCTRGYKFKSELRYYFGLSNKKHVGSYRFYAGANIFLTHQHYNSEIYYYPHNDSLGTVDGIGVKKDVLGFNILMGYQKPIGKKWFLDFYWGVGIRLRFFKTTDKQYVDGRDQLITPIEFNINSSQMQLEAAGGFSMAQNLTLGFRICYKIR